MSRPKRSCRGGVKIIHCLKTLLATHVDILALHNCERYWEVDARGVLAEFDLCAVNSAKDLGCADWKEKQST